MQYNQTNLTATCPACGMLCDDISISDTAANTCTKSIQFFAQASTNISPQIAGKNVSLSDAIAHITKLLNSSKEPLLAGLGTDLSGFRSAYQLAQKASATLAHMNATTTWRNLKVLQSIGWQQRR